MVKVTILLVLLLGLLCDCDNFQNERNKPNSYTYGSSRTRAKNDIIKTNNIQGEESRHFTMSDEPVLDSCPSKIPSLMDPSTSIGFLQPQEISLADQCFSRPQCDFFNPFRTMDGSCNNLQYPTWGQANTASTRIIQANYSDGYAQPRKSISGRELPNARKIRAAILQDIDKSSSKNNLFVMQYAQIVTHDTEFTLLKESGPNGPLKCCNEDGSAPEILPKECLQIKISDDNEPFSKHRCLSVPRALDTSDRGCNIKPVRQMIGVSSFIDASILYGSDLETSRSIRKFKNGKLRRQLGPNGKSYLPNAKKATELCNVTLDSTVCYVTGDPRVNIQPDMSVVTILLMRLHNYLCDELKRLNPKWDDERIYQEARRLLIAMHQHVTYNELVPVILGKDFARENYLLPLSKGFDDSYDQYLNPTTITSFTAAAFRSLHSSIRGFIELVNEARKITSKIRLSDFFFKPDIVQKQDNYDSFTRGLLTQHAQEVDQYFTEEISEFAVRIPDRHQHIDLPSVDLERGRDYGEPSYNKFRQLCGLNEAKTFDDLIDQIDKKDIKALSKVYEHVDDVDYYVAGLLEKSKPESMLGHTFQCVVGEMFFRLKYGDRFYYEFGHQIGSFKLDQLEEIRKTTLGLIVCITSDIYSVQRNMFEVPSSRNPLVSCNSIAKLNLSAWKEDLDRRVAKKMKKTIIVFLFLVCVSCQCPKKEENGLRPEKKNQPESRCIHAKNVPKKNHFFRGEGTKNLTMRDEPAIVDPKPAKIPSLMTSTNAFGMLQPIQIDLADKCFPQPKCDPISPFRTIDGSCNNLNFPVWGQTNTASTRIIEANYFDGKSQQRKAISGRELPNSRHIRTTIFLDMDKPAPEHNVLVTQFGQMIAHDTELTFPKLSGNGGKLECCNPDGTTPRFLPKGCLPITIPQNDPGSKKRCMSIPRAADTSDIGCQIQPVRQLIGVTSFIDGSALYGSDPVTARSLRTFNNGKLKIQSGSNGRSFLPNVKKPTQSCNVPTDNSVCYASGDLRVNQHPNMAVNTISLMRLHNILCDEFKRLNPAWNDEKIYQESRRLLIAMYQHITYNEFVPVILGRDYSRENKLLPLSQGYDNNYDELLNPTTFTSFTGAAYRALHSYIQGSMDLVSESRQTTSTLRLSDIFLRPDIVQNKDNYDSLIRGMLTQHAQGQDQFFTTEITEFLFRSPNKTDGVDLITLDLERGRDFGIPSYNKFRQLCGLKAARSFGDLTDQISKKNVDALASLYEHVDDVDYYAAGMLEKQKPGSIFGHTFQCVIGEMFFRWKFGDRFFYEFGNQPGSFSLDQLNEIRKTSLAFLMCVTSDIRFIQRNAFDVPSSRNPLVSCNSITKLNLAPWRDS